MPYKDPEKQKAAVREGQRRRRARMKKQGVKQKQEPYSTSRAEYYREYMREYRAKKKKQKV